MQRVFTVKKQPSIGTDHTSHMENKYEITEERKMGILCVPPGRSQ